MRSCRPCGLLTMSGWYGGHQVRWYVHALEEVLVRTLSQFGLKSHTTSDVGVWIDGQRKIAAIGVAVSRWVTMHGSLSTNDPVVCQLTSFRGSQRAGFALNVCPDLSYYDAIIPCRIRDKEVHNPSWQNALLLLLLTLATYHPSPGDFHGKGIRA